ncbi:tRNA (N6-isopentenyl adenosine(37)-C2)-methylthiotransferase MiaB [Cohnella lubricantis]|uniref:tRNA-2-methylthio-N(6)-dimethylallyladenosine synthase n=1 Tax=Cohnella lubricantis TaxID=2163172 RepID=A0A841TDB2_9BACL|nr:tRNA (N6-isopentenyl adenosine(37)-C2)-methylthiotransferase MiaB [Cohnella lubricantis]MBB6677989.1 tRNA (N6-isopentenyl adenosine(37)-C2)-methylthiotransferase MiaB [Cohnella lubricantis]MBP2120550.1 tRNA-2-methylthio-N6-dimethylallyladenosine synthase [Cohnella lubricantis]
MDKDTKKDYSKYFDFSDAKVVSEEDGRMTYRINGRNVQIHSAPSYQDEKRRGKENIHVMAFGGSETEAVIEQFRELNQGRQLYYSITTYGCQMNEHDTEVMRGLFEEMGFQPTDDRTQADVILLNTCAVRENAEDKVFGELGHLKGLKVEKPGLILGVCGCMSQEAAVVNRILQKHAYVDLIFGTHNIHQLPHLLQDAYFGKEMVVEVWSKEGDIIENLPKKREGLRAWVNIMYGCDKFCTYCIVPYTRGKERSRLPEDVIAEVRELARQGYKEITLLGQNVNAYGKDFTDRKYRFGDLMDDIRGIGIPRVRFTTSHPRDFDDHLIEVLAKGGNLVEHIHLPVQSGSSEVLKRMSRKYTREHFLDLVRRIKAAIPDVVLTTDIIVGFPGETEEQFEETLSLVREVRFASAFTFIYSPREGTPAASMADNVPYEVKQQRLVRLNELIGELSLKSNESLAGQTVEVLVEGQSKNNPNVLSGRTRSNKLIHFEGPKEWIGEFVQVRVTKPQTWYITAEAVQPPERAALSNGA